MRWKRVTFYTQIAQQQQIELSKKMREKRINNNNFETKNEERSDKCNIATSGSRRRNQSCRRSSSSTKNVNLVVIYFLAIPWSRCFSWLARHHTHAYCALHRWVCVSVSGTHRRRESEICSPIDDICCSFKSFHCNRDRITHATLHSKCFMLFLLFVIFQFLFFLSPFPICIHNSQSYVNETDGSLLCHSSAFMAPDVICHLPFAHEMISMIPHTLRSNNRETPCQFAIAHLILFVGRAVRGGRCRE